LVLRRRHKETVIFFGLAEFLLLAFALRVNQRAFLGGALRSFEPLRQLAN